MEVVIAMAIVAVGIVAVHQGFIRCLTAMKRSEERLLTNLLLEKAAVCMQLGGEGGRPAEKTALAALSKNVEAYPGYQLSAYTEQMTRNKAEFRSLRLVVRAPGGATADTSVLLERPDE